jgi:electron transport complex protein RnfA
MSAPVQLAALAVFSSLSLNLILQCGLGLRNIRAVRKGDDAIPLPQTGILLISVLLLWVIFSYVISPLFLGFLVYLLLFPLSALVYAGLEFFFYRVMLKKKSRNSRISASCDGLTAAALFLTLHLASGFMEAAVLAFGFAFGVLLAMLILDEIYRQSGMEAVPRFLRGSPLALISMGFLSLIFTSASLMLFKAVGGY